MQIFTFLYFLCKNTDPVAPMDGAGGGPQRRGVRPGPHLPHPQTEKGSPPMYVTLSKTKWPGHFSPGMKNNVLTKPCTSCAQGPPHPHPATAPVHRVPAWPSGELRLHTDHGPHHCDLLGRVG